MPQVPFDPVAIAELHFCVTASDYTAITTTEVNAGIRLTPYVLDGAPAAAGSNTINAGALDSAFESQVASTYGGGTASLTVRRVRDTTTTDDTADDAYVALPRGTVGYLVSAPYGVGGAAGAVATGDTVDVYPIEVSNRVSNIVRGQLATGTIEVAFNNPIVQNYDLVT